VSTIRFAVQDRASPLTGIGGGADLKAAKGLTNAWWDSIHVFEVTEGKTPKTFDYKLTSTVMVQIVRCRPGSVGANVISGVLSDLTRCRERQSWRCGSLWQYDAAVLLASCDGCRC